MSETTGKRILDTALELLLEQGIRKTSMDEVAERAGVTRVTIYRHFRDKKELVRAVFLRIADGIEARQRRLRRRTCRTTSAPTSTTSGRYFGTLPQGDLGARTRGALARLPRRLGRVLAASRGGDPQDVRTHPRDRRQPGAGARRPAPPRRRGVLPGGGRSMSWSIRLWCRSTSPWARSTRPPRRSSCTASSRTRATESTTTLASA